MNTLKANPNTKVADRDGLVSVYLPDRQRGFSVAGVAGEAVVSILNYLSRANNGATRADLKAEIAHLVDSAGATELLDQLSQRGVLETSDAGTRNLRTDSSFRILALFHDRSTARTVSNPASQYEAWLADAGVDLAGAEDAELEAMCRVGDGPGLVIVVDNSGDDRRMLRLNSQLSALGQPWLAIRVSSGRAEVGPMVFPGDSSCYRCLLTRMFGNLELPMQTVGVLAGDRALIGSTDLESSAAWVVALAQAAALSKGDVAPFLIGSIWQFDTANAGSHVSAVVQLAGCEDCRSAQLRGTK